MVAVGTFWAVIVKYICIYHLRIISLGSWGQIPRCLSFQSTYLNSLDRSLLASCRELLPLLPNAWASEQFISMDFQSGVETYGKMIRAKKEHIFAPKQFCFQNNSQLPQFFYRSHRRSKKLLQLVTSLSSFYAEENLLKCWQWSQL